MMINRAFEQDATIFLIILHANVCLMYMYYSSYNHCFITHIITQLITNT